MKKILGAAAVLVAAVAAPAWAIEAHRLAGAETIVLDGRLDDSGWRNAKLHDRFWEIFPEAQVEARVRTEVRYAYDA